MNNKMTNFTLAKKLFLASAGSATMLLLASEFKPAIAARLTFEVTGNITALDGGGESLDSLRDNNIGDSVTGIYSFDDAVTIGDNLSPLIEFSVEFLSGETLNLSFFQQGTIHLETGEIRLPDPALPFPIFAGFTAINNTFGYGFGNTGIEGTFFAKQVESIPEPGLVFSLVAMGIGGATSAFKKAKL